VCRENGACVVSGSRFGRFAGVRESGSCSGNIGCCATRYLLGNDVAGCSALDVGSNGDVGTFDVVTDCGVGDTNESSAEGAIGVPVGDVGSCGSGVVDGSGVESNGSSSVDAGPALLGGLPRGVHWARNKAKREKRKKRSDGEEVVSEKVPEWRRSASPVVGVGVISCGDSIVAGDVGSSVVEKGPVVSGHGFVASLDEIQRKSLLSSRAKMMEVQNKLAQEKAERDLEVLKAVDLELEKRKNIARIRAATERSMVSIEKAHALLVSTDNVPRDQVDHDVHTVLTGGVPELSSGSISPNSSASMAEFRELHKKSLDLEKRNSELIEMLSKVGISAEHFDKYDKRTWTDTPENQAILDEMYPGDFVMDYSLAPKGKFHLVA